MNLEDIWIGDKIYIKSKSCIGIYEGKLDASTAKVKINNEVFEISIEDLDEARPEQHINKSLSKLNKELKKNRATKPPKFVDQQDTKIDLHIESLAPHLSEEAPHDILQHQLMRCEIFITEAIENRLLMVTLIHGIGNGKLKQEIIDILANYPEVNNHFDKAGGGAMEIWMKY